MARWSMLVISAGRTWSVDLPANRTLVIGRAPDAGEYHSCALLEDGSVTCWGDNAAGQSSAPTQLTDARTQRRAPETIALPSSGSFQPSSVLDVVGAVAYREALERLTS